MPAIDQSAELRHRTFSTLPADPGGRAVSTNQAERDVRPAKTQIKVSGTPPVPAPVRRTIYRTLMGASTYDTST